MFTKKTPRDLETRLSYGQESSKPVRTARAEIHDFRLVLTGPSFVWCSFLVYIYITIISKNGTTEYFANQAQ